MPDPRLADPDMKRTASGLGDLRPGYELALLDNEAPNPVVGYWKVKAIHDGGVELWDDSRQRTVWLVMDEYGRLAQNDPSEQSDAV